MSELTLILVTIHPKKIKKFIKYHPGIEIIIVDGSSEQVPSGIDVKKYLKLEGKSYFSRVNLALSYVNTDFVMLAGDDEFFNLKLIQTAVRENGGHVSAIIGRTLEHFGIKPNSFHEQYNFFSLGIRELNHVHGDIETVTSFLVENLVFWYAAFRTEIFIEYCSKFSKDEEMANFEIGLPFHVLDQPQGRILTVSGIWLKRAKYLRNVKQSSVQIPNYVSHRSNLLELGYRLKAHLYIYQRGKTGQVRIMIWNGIWRRLLVLLYRLGGIKPNWNHDI